MSLQTLVLRLSKPKSGKKVHWGEDIVDNEHMGKKKSKCEPNHHHHTPLVEVL